MTDDLLGVVLAAADDADCVFDSAVTASWPSDAVATLRSLGLLRRAAVGLHAPCPMCWDRHVEPVTVRQGADGVQRFYIWCPESMRVEVTPAMCTAWEIDPTGLAKAVAVSLGLKATPTPIVADRFWRLGRVAWCGKTRQVVLARRMGDDDAGRMAAHVGPGGRTLVLVPHHRPDPRIWSGSVPAVLVLSQALTWDGAGLVLDAEAVADAIEAADRRLDSADTMALGSTAKTMVRRQVKAEIKSLLTDDAYVAAYTQHGSYRKAADALTEQTGQPIGKDKVRRAIERRGGLAQLVPDRDSSSVARTVASQRRDRSTKILVRR